MVVNQQDNPSIGNGSVQRLEVEESTRHKLVSATFQLCSIWVLAILYFANKIDSRTWPINSNLRMFLIFHPVA